MSTRQVLEQAHFSGYMTGVVTATIITSLVDNSRVGMWCGRPNLGPSLIPSHLLGSACGAILPI